MRLLANENFPLDSVRLLQTQGFDTRAVGTDFQGILDVEVIEIAIREKRLILTFDRDYGELIFLRGYKPLEGVIYFRLIDFKPMDPGNLLLDLLRNKKMNFHGMFSVVGNNYIRQRKIQ